MTATALTLALAAIGLAGAARSGARVDEGDAGSPEDRRVIQRVELSAGVRATVGTHTVSADTTVAVDAFHELPSRRAPGFGVGVVALATLGGYQRQWGWPYRGGELELATFGLVGHRYLRLGVGVHLYRGRSWAELGLRGRPSDRPLAALDQGVGTVLLQSRFGGADGLRSALQLSFSDDVFLPRALLFGDGGDAFRTADVELAYLHAIGVTTIRAAAVLLLRTGVVDHDRPDPDRPGWADLRGLPWSDQSTGLFALRGGVFRVFRRGVVGHEIGLHLGLGADAEAIRNATQNRLHRLLGDLQVPLLDRPSRFFLEINAGYRILFDVAPRGSLSPGRRGSPTGLLAAGHRP